MNEFKMVTIVLILLAGGTTSLRAEDAIGTTEAAKRSLIVVIGAPGELAFGDQFRSTGRAWEELAKKQQWKMTLIGREPSKETSDRGRFEQAIADAIELDESADLWIVLIGHGTFGSNLAKFNLSGPDIAATELNNWLKPIRAKTVIINCSSSSGPFLTALSGQNRIVVTATKSGSEQNYSRFGKYFAESLSDLSADVDHDREISLLEGFLAASSRTERFYLEEARLATEHALLDDNGDRVGTASDFYRGVRPAKEVETGKKIDGGLAAKEILFSAPNAIRLSIDQQVERSRIETALDSLKKQKSQIGEQAYLDQLEPLMVELAKLYSTAVKP